MIVACLGCKSAAPQLNGEVTLISQKGWRLHRQVARDGTLLLDWFCPACWAERKARDAAAKKP